MSDWEAIDRNFDEGVMWTKTMPKEEAMQTKEEVVFRDEARQEAVLYIPPHHDDVTGLSLMTYDDDDDMYHHWYVVQVTIGLARIMHWTRGDRDVKTRRHRQQTLRQLE